MALLATVSFVIAAIIIIIIVVVKLLFSLQYVMPSARQTFGRCICNDNKLGEIFFQDPFREHCSAVLFSLVYLSICILTRLNTLNSK